MKHHAFLFVLIFSCSVSAMHHEMKNMTKGQFINRLTEINCYMKQNHSHMFDTQDFGRFIVGLRSVNKDVFESKKEELFSLLMPLNVSDQLE